MSKILIVDDEELMCRALTRKVVSMGHEAACAGTLKEGIRKTMSDYYDVIFLDVRMPDGNGLDAIAPMRSSSSQPEVIIITGAGDPDGAELAIRNGAWDYIEKNASLNMMVLPMVRALQYREAAKIKNPLPAMKPHNIVGSSPAVKTILAQAAQASQTDTSVLITGNTGTGKELLALAIHKNSARADGNFVVVDCAALSETLVESMLFGYEKGAYTSADRAREGLIKQADGGTLFLDEIGELPFSIQKAFLRVLQERRFRPLGSKQEIESDFRLISATNRRLDEMAAKGLFRNDLLFRLKAFAIEVPVLLDRLEDIPDLVQHHLAKICQRYGIPMKDPSLEFMEALSRYDWPGNVRELMNTLEWSLTVSHNDQVLYAKHLPSHVRIKAARAKVGGNTPVKTAPPTEAIPVPVGEPEPVAERQMRPQAAPESLAPLQEIRDAAIEGIERQYLADLLALTGANIKNACRISGLSRSRLYELMKKYGISKTAASNAPD
jgi:two-component system NtrC family response regulator